MLLGIVDNVRKYILAAQTAMAEHDRILYSYFFNDIDWSTVRDVYININRRLNKHGPLVAVKCADDEIRHVAKCSDSDGAFTLPTETSSLIVLCPTFFTLPDLPDACDRAALGIDPETALPLASHTKTVIFLHEMTHLLYIAGQQIKQIRDQTRHGALGAHLLKMLVKQVPGEVIYVAMGDNAEPGTPTRNAANYDQLAQWAWMRGQQQRGCPEAYPLWNVLTQDTTPKAKDELKVELRRLLNHNHNLDDVMFCVGVNWEKEECKAFKAIQSDPASFGTEPVVQGVGELGS